MLLLGRVDGSADSAAYEILAETLRSLLPAAERFGIVKAGDMEIDTLAARLREQVSGGGGVILMPLLIGAWTRKR